jgi:hypothetical protein
VFSFSQALARIILVFRLSGRGVAASFVRSQGS